MNCVSLFTGQGGFDLAADWMGWNTVAQCEINPFTRQILRYYWPDAELFEDITKTDFTKYAGLIDILTGGFPCQPYSVAGKQAGTADDRHLWPEMLRAIREIKPRWVVGENVRGLVSWSGGLVFDQVQLDLEAEGYEVQPFLLPAASVNAPHRRDRIWFVAYSSKGGRGKQQSGQPNEFTAQGRETRNTTNAERSGLSQPEQGGQFVTVFDVERNDTQAGLSANAHKGGLQTPGAKLDTTGFEQHRELDISDPAYWSVTDTDDERGGSRPRSVQGKNGEVPKRYDNAEPCHTGELDAPHTESFRVEGYWSDREQEPQPHVAEGLPVCSGQPGAVDYWQNFPTQSPVCDGDDGLSPYLDASAVYGKPCKPAHARPFPKWRNESIKAGGNAIVPQVVLQIYDAIETYELLYR